MFLSISSRPRMTVRGRKGLAVDDRKIWDRKTEEAGEKWEMGCQECSVFLSKMFLSIPVGCERPCGAAKGWRLTTGKFGTEKQRGPGEKWEMGCQECSVFLSQMFL